MNVQRKATTVVEIDEMAEIKNRLDAAGETIQSIRDEQIQKKTQKDALQNQLKELILQTQNEFGLKPEELEEKIAQLKSETETMLAEIEQTLANVE